MPARYRTVLGLAAVAGFALTSKLSGTSPSLEAPLMPPSTGSFDCPASRQAGHRITVTKIKLRVFRARQQKFASGSRMEYQCEVKTP